MLKTAKFDLWWPLVTWPLTWPKNWPKSFRHYFCSSLRHYLRSFRCRLPRVTIWPRSRVRRGVKTPPPLSAPSTTRKTQATSTAGVNVTGFTFVWPEFYLRLLERNELLSMENTRTKSQYCPDFRKEAFLAQLSSCYVADLHIQIKTIISLHASDVIIIHKAKKKNIERHEFKHTLICLNSCLFEKRNKHEFIADRS